MRAFVSGDAASKVKPEEPHQPVYPTQEGAPRGGCEEPDDKKVTPPASAGGDKHKAPAASAGEDKDKTPAASAGEEKDKTPAASGAKAKANTPVASAADD